MLPLFLAFRWLNCTTGLMKAVLNDYIRKSNRSKWNALESLNLFSWSGSAALGGVLIDAVGYRNTFRVTAVLQTLSILCVVPLMTLVPAEKGAKARRPRWRSSERGAAERLLPSTVPSSSVTDGGSPGAGTARGRPS